jgi:hypothetical protein
MPIDVGRYLATRYEVSLVDAALRQKEILMSDKVYFVDSIAQAIAQAQSEALRRYGKIGLIRKYEAEQIVSMSRTVKVKLQIGASLEWFTVHLEKTEAGWAPKPDKKENIMNESKLQKMALVKRILTERELAVNRLFHPTLFRLLGGEQMLTLIEAQDTSYEAWRVVGKTASDLMGLDFAAAHVIEWLVVFIQSEEDSVSHWGKEEALSAAEENLADWLFARRMAEAAPAKLAIRHAGAVVKAAEQAAQEPDEDEEESSVSPFEAAVWRLDQALFPEAYQARPQLRAHWLSLGAYPELVSVELLDQARRIVRAYPVGSSIGGYVEGLVEEDGHKYILHAFVGTEQEQLPVSALVLDALEAEGLIKNTSATPSWGSLPEGTLFVYVRLS